MKKLISATLAATLALSPGRLRLHRFHRFRRPHPLRLPPPRAPQLLPRLPSPPPRPANLAGTTLKVAASPTPHAEILNVAKEVLAEQGIDLEVVEFSDYVQPNLVTESGEVDANYFQHTPYLDSFNEENGTHLVSVGAVHYEPFGIYPGKSERPRQHRGRRDHRRAQRHHQRGPRPAAAGRPGPDHRPRRRRSDRHRQRHHRQPPQRCRSEEIEAAQLPRTVQDVDFAVINGNYAMEAGFSVGKDALATEDASSEAAQTYANVLVVKEGRENDPAIQALYAALTSDKVKDYINSTYDGAVVPIF